MKKGSPESEKSMVQKYKQVQDCMYLHKEFHVRTHNSTQLFGFILHLLWLHKTPDVQTLTSKVFDMG